MDVITQPYDDARRAIEHRLADILDAVHAGDLERLASYHLDSPKFTKFNDSPPWSGRTTPPRWTRKRPSSGHWTRSAAPSRT